MVIRQATEADIVKASRLWLDMLAEMAPQFDTPNVKWWREIATTSMRQGTYFMLVADEGGKIVGFLDWFLFPEPSTGQVHAVGQHLFLEDAYRGVGFGRELYERALAWAKKHEIKSIDMFCFDNEKPMWLRRGFTPLRTLLRKEV
jgi:GNAT superfamily N-acetyltransferase